jgi:hypothetical protein
MRRVLSAAILLVGWGPVLAADMPHFDVAAQCKKVASFGGPFSETTFAGCMEMEQSAYDQLKETWPNLNTSMKNQCSKIASFGGPGSYTTLQGCVEMEREAASSNQNRQFKY